MPETEQKKRTPRDLLRMIFRRWRLFLLSASLVAVIAMLVGQAVPLKYMGEATLERTIDPAAADIPGVKRDVEAARSTQEDELIGWKAMTAAADDMGLIRGDRYRQGSTGQLTTEGLKVVRGLKAATKVRWESRSERVDRVVVSFEDTDPNRAETMPNRLVENYRHEMAAKASEKLRNSRTFLMGQIAEATRRLDDHVKTRQEFEAKHKEVKPQEQGYLSQQRLQVESDLQRMEQMKTALETRLAVLGARGTTPTSAPASQPAVSVSIPSPRLARLKDELQAVRDDRETAKRINRMTDNHPTIIALNQKVKILEEKIQEAEGEATTPPGLTGMGAMPGAPNVLGIQVQAAKEDIELVKKEMQRLGERRDELIRLEGVLADARPEHAKLVKKEQELDAERARWVAQLSAIQMSYDAEVEKHRLELRLVQPALRQSRPSSPSLWFIVGFALVGGLGFGAALVFLMQVLDRSITTTEEAIRHFGLPVQGVVEEIVTPRLRARRRLAKWTLIPAVVVVVTASLAVAGSNIKVWLRDAEPFRQWRGNAPDSFVNRQMYFWGMPRPPAPAAPSASGKSPQTTATGAATKPTTTAGTTSPAASVPSSQGSSGGPSSAPSTAPQAAPESQPAPDTQAASKGA